MSWFYKLLMKPCEAPGEPKTRPDFCVRVCSATRHRRIRRVAVSHEEYCFLKGSQGCVTLNLPKSMTVELKLCEPRMKMTGSEGDCVVTARLFVWNMTLGYLPLYLRIKINEKREIRASRVSLHSVAEQLPHNKMETFVIAFDWATCNMLNESSWTNTDDVKICLFIIIVV